MKKQIEAFKRNPGSIRNMPISLDDIFTKKEKEMYLDFQKEIQALIKKYHMDAKLLIGYSFLIPINEPGVVQYMANGSTTFYYDIVSDTVSMNEDLGVDFANMEWTTLRNYQELKEHLEKNINRIKNK